MRRIFLTLAFSLILFSCNKHEEIIQKQINSYIQSGIEKESSQPGEAVSLYLKALTHSEQIDDTESLRQCYTNLAIVYRSCELFPEAEHHYLEALRVAHRISPLHEAKTLRNMGQLYKTWGNYTKAEQYYTQALEVFKKMGDQKFLSVLNNDLGILAECRHNYQNALEYYQKARRTDGVDLFNIGRMQVKLGRPEVGLQNIEKGIAVLKTGTDTPNLSAAMIARVEALIALKRTDEAKAALVEAEITSGGLTGMQRKNLLEVYSLAQKLYGKNEYILYQQKTEKLKSELDLVQESGRSARFRDQSLIRKAEADRAALFYRTEKTHKQLIALFACTTVVALIALYIQYWRVKYKQKLSTKFVGAATRRKKKTEY